MKFHSQTLQNNSRLESLLPFVEHKCLSPSNVLAHINVIMQLQTILTISRRVDLFKLNASVYACENKPIRSSSSTHRQFRGLTNRIWLEKLSRVIAALCENKRRNCEADPCHCFRYADCTVTLLSKSEISGL